MKSVYVFVTYPLFNENSRCMPAEIAHFSYFAFQLGARRAMDYAEFFIKDAPEFAAIKEKQAKQFGRCHTLIVEKNFQALADALYELAEMEEKFRRVICES